jgi:hypothetical protein
MINYGMTNDEAITILKNLELPLPNINSNEITEPDERWIAINMAIEALEKEAEYEHKRTL